MDVLQIENWGGAAIRAWLRRFTPGDAVQVTVGTRDAYLAAKEARGAAHMAWGKGNYSVLRNGTLLTIRRKA